MVIVTRDTCRQLDSALAREWLVTNGIGGYGSGTVAGVNTRRYHGLLIAALRPPHGRTLMLARVDEELIVDDRTFYLGASEYHDGTINPNGYIHLEQCRVEDGIPSFRFAVPGADLEKTIWMEDGQNTTYVRYTLGLDSEPVTLRLVLFATYRDHHRETNGAPDWTFAVQDLDSGVEIAAFPEAVRLKVRTQPRAHFIQTGVWYWRCLHRRERERGLDALEDLYTPGLFVAHLEPGQSITLQASAEPWDVLPTDLADAYARRVERQRKLVLISPVAAESPDLRDLVAAADQFVVRSRSANPKESANVGILAGYPWFTEWGRDALISLPGLLLANGRTNEARAVLRRLAGRIDHGSVPNRVPDEDGPPEYNAVDPSLWLFQALEHYLDATRDDDLLGELFAPLESVLNWYREGTRYGVRVDDDDGLLLAGAMGVQLTWMDAKVGDWVVTPRRGKPVEVNALWYNALRLMDGWSRRLGRPAGRYRDDAQQVYASFNRRFWNAEGGCLYDVVDLDEADQDDAAIRPNQCFAIGLVYPTLDPRRWDAVLDRVDASLLTPYGLRTLAPGSPGYVGRFEGDQRNRDSAYHQGSVWPWLMGAYVDAARRAGRDLGRARAVLSQLVRSVDGYGLGTIAELFDGDSPQRPGGTLAQAWSVAELLRAWRRVSQE